LEKEAVMAKIIFKNPKITNQVVADTIGVVNFGTVQNKAELITELRKLTSEINKAVQEGVIVKDLSTEVKTYIKKAITEAEKPEPKKKKIVENIEGAKSLLDGVTSASNLVSALVTASKIVGSLFL
jgi:ribosomal protein S20